MSGVLAMMTVIIIMKMMEEKERWWGYHLQVRTAERVKVGAWEEQRRGTEEGQEFLSRITENRSSMQLTPLCRDWRMLVCLISVLWSGAVDVTIISLIPKILRLQTKFVVDILIEALYFSDVTSHTNSNQEKEKSQAERRSASASDTSQKEMSGEEDVELKINEYIDKNGKDILL